MKIINGRILAEKIKDDIVGEIVKLRGKRPNLAVILIGEREDSRLYVDLKEKEAKRVGIDTHTYRCPVDIPESELLSIIKHLNNDELIDAILIQMPLPSGLDAARIIKTVDPCKDVDRFHPKNLKILFKTCDHFSVVPPVFSAISAILESIDCNLTNQIVCIVANSDIFGRSLARFLECRRAKCVLVRPDDCALSAETARADILITAVGRKHFIKKSEVKKNAVVIDVGVVREGKKVYGDVDIDDVADTAGYITPVPGGVGPMTIAMLFKNTLALYKRRHRSAG